MTETQTAIFTISKLEQKRRYLSRVIILPGTSFSGWFF